MLKTMLKGKAMRFGNDISTDLIAPGRYTHLRSNLPELAKHAFEDADPNFTARVQQGDFVIAGKNFGLGSSREQAPSTLRNLSTGDRLNFNKLPSVMIQILDEGGLIPYVKKFSDFTFQD